MRSLHRLLTAILLGTCPLSSQTIPNYTTSVTLTRLLAGGVVVQSARVCATPADRLGHPLPVSAPTWGLLLPDPPLCAMVSDGVLVGGLRVPDANHTNAAAPIFYNFSIQVLTDGVPTPAVAPVVLRAVPNVTGATFALDAYAPIAPAAEGSSTSAADGRAQPPAAVMSTTASSPGGAIYGEMDQVSHNLVTYGPGWSLGNFGGWNVDKNMVLNLKAGRRGIKQVLSITNDSHAIGDSAAIYTYTNTDGNTSAPSDENATGINAEVNENYGPFHGIVTATSGLGDIVPALFPGPLGVNSGQTYRGNYNPATSYAAGDVVQFTNGSGIANYYASTVPANVGNQPPAAGWSVQSLQASNPWTTDGAILLDLSQGRIAGRLAGAGQFGSTNLGQFAVAGVTLPLTTAWGTCSAAVPTSNRTADVGVAVQCSVTLGAIGGTTPPLVAGGVVWVAGVNYAELAPITAVGAVSANVQPVTLTLRYPNSSFCIFQGGLVGQYISLDANLAFFGTHFADFAFGSLTGSDLIVGRKGNGTIHRNFPQAGNEAATSSGAAAGFHLYPGAEVVQNSLPGDSHAPVLEPNGVAWTVGDLVENPHPTTFGGHAIWATKRQWSPTDASFGSVGAAVDVEGTGIGGSFNLLNLRNGSSDNFYSFRGGPLAAPAGVRLEGALGAILRSEYGPSGGRSMFEVAHTAASDSAAYSLFNIPGFSAFVDPSTRTLQSDSTLGLVRATFAASPSGPPGVTVDSTGVHQTAGLSNFDRISVNAIAAAGQAGFTGNIPLGGGTLHVTGGLITGYTTP